MRKWDKKTALQRQGVSHLRAFKAFPRRNRLSACAPHTLPHRESRARTLYAVLYACVCVCVCSPLYAPHTLPQTHREQQEETERRVCVRGESAPKRATGRRFSASMTTQYVGARTKRFGSRRNRIESVRVKSGIRALTLS